ncbi:hypothetical protein PHMEG_000193 [Phytophthora megakarya]|uniref:LisH domain-containing protein n=1 Tax=Phytophthora megakarya TaxID=4795 RepID=A0A225X469_9STRA|nr:hypothetical protein PHMEG_000193 [Phytophthora megakarya]
MLTSQGVLAKLKAELRAAVFEVMHEREGFVNNLDPHGPKLSDFPVETRATALSLIVDCLQFFHWDNALRVLLAETNAENEQHDSVLLAKKLRLVDNSSSSKPILFQLVESQLDDGDQVPPTIKTSTTLKYDHFDDEEEADQVKKISPPNPKIWEQKEVIQQLPPKETSNALETAKDEANDEANDKDGESSAEIEESMAEEVPSESELGESNYTKYDDEDSQAATGKQSTTPYASRLQKESEDDDKTEDNHHDYDESDTDDAVSLAAPPPAPAKLPALPPLVGIPSNTVTDGAEDDFDAVSACIEVSMNS